MAVNLKLGVDMSAFKSGIQEANAQLKTFDAQLKFAETTFKKTGDAEAAMATKTDALSNKLKVQKQVVQQYEKALQDMKNAGVEPASKSYQQMQAAMLNMQSAANETEIALNGLSTSQLNAAISADKLNNSVSSIGKKMSLDQVIGGIDKITSGLENAAKKAVQLGEELWNNVMSRAQWADDTATAALMYGIDLDTYMRMQKLVTNGLDTSVDAILTSQSKLKRGIGSDTKAVSKALSEMGIALNTVVGQGKYGPIEQAKDSMELFWEVGQKLMTWGDEYQKEDMAQKLFGRGWKELVPLFSQYKSIDEYNAALQEVNVSSEEDVNALAELNDKVGELKGNLEQLSTDILAQLAPALTEGAEALNGLLTSLLDYLQTDEGKEMLKSLGDAVSGLFSDLSKIDPQEVISGFTGVFNTVISGLDWLVQNKNSVIHALEAIVIGWAGLKLTGGALEIMKLINGVQTFNGIDTGTPQNVTGGDGTLLATGTSGGGFWSNLLNKATLFAAANAMYEATEGQIRSNVDNFNKATEGMTDAQKNREALRIGFGMTDEEIDTYIDNVNQKLSGGRDILLPTELEPEENAAQKLAEEVGTVTVPASLDWRPSYQQGYQKQVPGFGGHANGLPFVPYDGYLALLHRGERVMTASQNKSYTYNNNTYFGSVNLNNGLEIDALTESIARNNRRKNSGYGA